MQSLTTTFSEKQKTNEAKFNEKRQNLDSDSTNGTQPYKQRKNFEETVHKSKIAVLQAKHDKSSMSFKSYIEFQSSMYEVGKSLYENQKS